MHWGRISAGIIAISTAAWAAGSDWADGVPYEPLIGLFVTISAWLGFEVNESIPKNISPNDRRLSVQIRDTFSADVRSFLKTHSFGVAFSNRLLSGLEDLESSWKTMSSGFDNKDLDEIGNKIIKSVGDFLNLIVLSVEPVSEHLLAVPTRAERANDMFSKHTEDTIEKIETLSRDIITYLEAFERRLRKLAPDIFS